MAQTITPVVHGGSRRRWAGAIALHVLGATFSAGLLGLVLGATGSLLDAPWGRGAMDVIAVIALAYAAREILGVRVPLPELRRQVPEWWRGTLGPRVVAFLYGVALGPGFLTHLRHGTFVAAAIVAVALGDPALGLVVIAPFGLARGLGVALASAARTEPAMMRASERLERIGAGRLPRVANAVALLAVAGTVVAGSAGSGVPAPWLWPLLLATTFMWAAVGKLLRSSGWRAALRAVALPRWIERLARFAVPIMEATCAVLLLTGSLRIGSALAVGLLVMFTITLATAPRSGDGRLPCGCFGGTARRSVRWLLTRNAVLGLVAVASLTAGSRIPMPGLPPSSQVLPASLAAVGLALAVLIVRRSAHLWSGQEIGPLSTK